MHRIKGLLFDKDGTLFDFHKTWGVWTAGFIREIAAGPAEAAALGVALGFDADTLSFTPESVVIAGTPDDNIDAISSVLGSVDRDAMRARILKSSANAPLAPAVPLGPLLELFEAAGIVLGVATNDSESVARAHLEQAGVVERFVFIAGFDSGYGAKPAPGMQQPHADVVLPDIGHIPSWIGL